LDTAPVEKNKNLSERQEKKTRRAEMIEKGIDLEIPEVGAPFILTQLYEIGPIMAGGLGPAAIDWRDLVAWQECMSIKLPPWHCRMLVSLSREYLNFTKKAEEPSCESPLATEVQKANVREAVNRSLRIGFKALMTNSRLKRSKPQSPVSTHQKR
jgi:hypothetical protein